MYNITQRMLHNTVIHQNKTQEDTMQCQSQY